MGPRVRAASPQNGGRGTAYPLRGSRLPRPRAQEQVEDRGELERVDRFRNHRSREEEHARARRDRECGIEARSFAEEAASEDERQQHEPDHRERDRKARRELRLSEDRVAGRHCPVMQWRFHQIADAVQEHHHEVAALQHFAGNESMGGVRVVQKRQAKRIADKDDAGDRR